jgi:hypothetical protein
MAERRRLQIKRVLKATRNHSRSEALGTRMEREPDAGAIVVIERGAEGRSWSRATRPYWAGGVTVIIQDADESHESLSRRVRARIRELRGEARRPARVTIVAADDPGHIEGRALLIRDVVAALSDASATVVLEAPASHERSLLAVASALRDHAITPVRVRTDLAA